VVQIEVRGNVERPYVRLVTICSAVLMAVITGCFEKNDEGKLMPTVLVETTMGNFKIELWAGNAPATVENFLKYVDEGFYAGTIFHRVIDGFMIQGGGFTYDMQQKPTHPPVKNEARSDVKNLRGTVAMARTSVVDSATAQFFVNLVDNDFLDHKNATARGFGYTVFGKVVSGMDVVDAIGKVRTTVIGEIDDVPEETIVITNITRLPE
jgi:cyclophilin family peptidyl-prolyl cis-trans isomerase